MTIRLFYLPWVYEIGCFKYICLLTNTLQRKINWLSLLPTAEHTHFSLSLSLSENYRWYSSLSGLDFFFFGLTYMRKKASPSDEEKYKTRFLRKRKKKFVFNKCQPDKKNLHAQWTNSRCKFILVVSGTHIPKKLSLSFTYSRSRFNWRPQWIFLS